MFAFAFRVRMPAPGSLFALMMGTAALGASTVAYAQETEERPLSITVRQQFLQDNNFLRLPQGVDPFPLVGVNSRSDLSSLTSVRAAYNNTISGQKISVYGELGANYYSNYSGFNNVSRDISGRWDWQYGRQWFGTVDLRHQEFLNSFASQQSLQKNLIGLDSLGLTGGYRFTPQWSAFTRVEEFRRKNSAQQLASADTEISTLELGARYDTATGNTVSAVFRHSDVRTPNRQVRDAAGNLLPVVIDNAATESRALIRATYAPTSASFLTGEAGFTQRRFENLPQRDFSGVTANVSYRYNITGSVVLNAAVRRDINNAEFVYASYTDAKVVNAGLSWQATGKLVVRANAEARRIDFDGDPGFIAGLTALRKDRLRSVSVGVDYEFLRRATLYGQIRSDSRSSSFSGFDFSANSIVVGAQLTF
jgi:exopolysaccharide biosynthesis operon protein EpsL